MKANLNSKQFLIYGSALIIFVIALSLFLAYFSGLRDPITVSFKRIYPAVLIDGRIISVNDLEQSGITGERLGLTFNEAQVHFLESEKKYALARKYNLKISSDLSADELRFYTKGNESEYQQLLSNVFGNEHFFRKYVVNPQVVDSQLRMKYFSDIKNSSPEYKRAQSVLDRISKGEKFEDLAKLESDDKATGQIGGDLGLYEPGQILPELEDMISISAVGEVRKDIITSRLGYHIIFPIEYVTVDGKKKWHAKHMLFAPEGYESWLENQTKEITAKYIKK
ncbi:MAG: peptidyl-prolyl cis-trans isomerase [Candidatus Doudnabacteria bacterium]|nr:peptidyl-prolyl cis-trans isomerase [Candidatus Doudnabacteria bacterium]